MSPLSTLRVAIRALTRNALRSTLTVLGIVIGVGAVIAMVAAGAGTREQLQSIFDTMGTNLMMVRPGPVTTGGARSADASSTLTWGDMEAIKAEVPGAAYTAPVLSLRSQISSEETNWNTQIVGTTPEFFQIRNWKVQAGRPLQDEDESGRRSGRSHHPHQDDAVRGHRTPRRKGPDGRNRQRRCRLHPVAHLSRQDRRRPGGLVEGPDLRQRGDARRRAAG
jgi:hypothetical protein